MAQQVADFHVLGNVIVVKLEPWQVFANRIVPVQHAVFHQNRQSRSGEGFGVRGNGKQSVFVDGVAAAKFPDSITLRKDNLVIFDDRHCKSRDWPIGEYLG